MMHFKTVQKRPPLLWVPVVLICLGVLLIICFLQGLAFLQKAQLEAAAGAAPESAKAVQEPPADNDDPQPENAAAFTAAESSQTETRPLDQRGPFAGSQTYTLETSAAVYRTPSTDSGILEELMAGTTLELTGYIKNDMVNVRTESGLVGYMDSRLVSADVVAELSSQKNNRVMATKAVNLFDSVFEMLTMDEKLKTLKKLFPDGKYWNSEGVDISGLSQDWAGSIVTEQPCSHIENGYEYCHEYDGVTSYLFDYPTNIQCLGFASLISDFLFGKEAPLILLNDFSQLQVGDHIRFIEYEHSMIVTEITANTVTVVQCNGDYENCMIEWGTTYTREEIESHYDVQYISRYADQAEAEDVYVAYTGEIGYTGDSDWT